MSLLLIIFFTEEYQEFFGYGCLKLHLFSCDGMVEIEAVGM